MAEKSSFKISVRLEHPFTTVVAIQRIVQSKLNRRLWKAASELVLQCFLWYLAQALALQILVLLQSNLDISKLMGVFFTSSNYPMCKWIRTSGNLGPVKSPQRQIMVGKSHQNVFLIQLDTSIFAEFEINEFEISKFDCICFLKALWHWMWKESETTFVNLAAKELSEKNNQKNICLLVLKPTLCLLQPVFYSEYHFSSKSNRVSRFWKADDTEIYF